MFRVAFEASIADPRVFTLATAVFRSDTIACALTSTDRIAFEASVAGITNAALVRLSTESGETVDITDWLTDVAIIVYEIVARNTRLAIVQDIEASLAHSTSDIGGGVVVVVTRSAGSWELATSQAVIDIAVRHTDTSFIIITGVTRVALWTSPGDSAFFANSSLITAARASCWAQRLTTISARD